MHNCKKKLTLLTAFVWFAGVTDACYADFNMPYSPDFENTSRVRAVDGSTCEARASQAAVQFGVYDAGNTVDMDDKKNPMDSTDRDRGAYAQVSIPLDLGGARKPDCYRFQQIMEENAELDLQLKRLEVKLKMERLRQMQGKINSSAFSE